MAFVARHQIQIQAQPGRIAALSPAGVFVLLPPCCPQPPSRPRKGVKSWALTAPWIPVPGGVQLVPGVIAALRPKQTGKISMCVQKSSAIGKPGVTCHCWALLHCFPVWCSWERAGVQRQRVIYSLQCIGIMGCEAWLSRNWAPNFTEVSGFLPISPALIWGCPGKRYTDTAQPPLKYLFQTIPFITSFFLFMFCVLKHFFKAITRKAVHSGTFRTQAASTFTSPLALCNPQWCAVRSRSGETQRLAFAEVSHSRSSSDPHAAFSGTPGLLKMPRREALPLRTLVVLLQLMLVPSRLASCLLNPCLEVRDL